LVGRERRCGVDETEKGWYLLYIVGDFETIALHEVLATTIRWVEMNRRKLRNLLKNKFIGKKSIVTS
jgi:hypothetical protein